MQKSSVFIRQNVFPVLTALIWGTAFVAQSVSTDHVGPLTFNALRMAIAFVVLAVVSFIFSRAERKKGGAVPAKKRGSRRELILGGICCGILLAAASNLQQLGLSDTSAGKAGFITALYVVLVPVFGIFLHKKASLPVWIGVILSVAGLYLLCIKDGFSIERSDFYIFLCAIIFALHILCSDHFVQKVDGVQLSCIQFLVAAAVSAVGMAFFESPSLSGIAQCIWPVLYVGVFSSGVAYTLQILALEGTDTTVVTILLSLESVFSVLAGAVILGDRLSPREYVGCVLMFAAVLLAQIPFPLKKKNKKAESF